MTTNHPSDETLAAFIDGRLDPETRRNVVEHLASCDDCYADWQAAAEFGEMEAGEATEAQGGAGVVRRGWFGERRWRAAAAVAAAMVVVLAIGPLRERLLGRSDMAELVEASKTLQSRPTQARLSGGFSHREPERIMRGPGDDEGDVELNLLPIRAEASRIRQKAGNKPSAADLHIFAAMHLLLHQWEQAVATAERALLAETNEADVIAAIHKSRNALLLNDVSAVYYARGQWIGDRSDYLKAFEAANRAKQLSPTPEILWNRALALQELGMTEDARVAWQEYLKVETDPAWAQEAREFLARLDDQASLSSATSTFRDELVAGLDKEDEPGVRRLVQQHPTDSRVLAEETLLPEWGRAHLASGTADRELRRVEVLGHVLERVSGDRIVRDGTVAIAAASPGMRRSLASAHADYRDARKQSQQEPTAAIAAFEDIARRFESARSPFAYLARMRKAGCVQRTAAYAEAIRETEVMPSPERLAKDGYLALAAQVEWTRGVVMIELNTPDRSLAAYERALVWFARLGERPNEAIAHFLAAQAADRIGDPDVALKHRLEGLSIRAASVEAVNHHQALIEAGLGLSSAGFTGAADVVLDRLVTIDRASANPTEPCTALLWRSFHRSRNERRSDAATDFAEAERYCRRIPDPKVRARVAENQAVVAGSLDRDRAVPNLTEAIAFADRTGNRFRSAFLHSQRAKAHLQANASAAAQLDARTALEQIDGQWQQVIPQLRESVVESVRQIVSQSIEAELAGGDLQAAFNAAEWQRSRVNLVGTVEQVLPLDRLRLLLDKDAALLSYHVGPDQLTVFAIRRTDAAARRIAVDQKTLSRDVESLRAAVVRDDRAAVISGATALYALVVSPVRPFLHDIRTLLIVPDGPLASLPFALLYDDAGRHLVETFSLVFLPSAAFIRETPPCERISSGDEALLVAGAPSMNRGDAPLSAASRELDDVAGLYPRARVLRNAEATTEAFLSAAEGAAVIHYAGHAIANERQPMLSALLMTSGDGGSPRSLYAHQIAKRTFRGCRLVVLSGCATGKRGAALRAPGSIAQAFLSAGAQAVVGTLWDVEDDVARQTSRRIHQSIAAGASVAEAVRAVQLEMLRSPLPQRRAARAWASLTAMGGCDGRGRAQKS